MNDILPMLLQHCVSYIKENRQNPIVKEFILDILDDLLKEKRALFYNLKDEILKL